VLVSVIIPALRWDAQLAGAVASVGSQRLPPGVQVEVAVALADLSGAPDRDGLLLITNPGGSIPVGLNRAIAATTGAVVARVESRCRLAPDHLARMLDGLADARVGSVGGAQLVTDRGVLGSAYAVAFNSPLLGPSRYRFSRTSGATDSPYLGAWRRETLEAVRGFDERLTRNQDNDLADRVRNRGFEVRYDADAVVGYTSGRSLPATLRHHHSFGRWRTAQQRQGGNGFAPRHAAVVGAAAAIGAAGLAALARPHTRRWALAGAAATYVGSSLGAWRTASRLAAARPDLGLAPLDPIGVAAAPALAASIDVAWLAGVLQGAASAVRRRPG
jgi:succinoglycan biosynthesis protein ExoA